MQSSGGERLPKLPEHTYNQVDYLAAVSAARKHVADALAGKVSQPLVNPDRVLVIGENLVTGIADIRKATVARMVIKAIHDQEESRISRAE